MASHRLAWLLAVAVCVACAGGKPPPPPTRPPTASLAVTAAATPAATADFAPATAPPSGAASTPAPTLAATATLTAALGVIAPANALSVTQLAVITTTGKTDHLAWAPAGGRLAVAGADGVTIYDTAALTVTQVLTAGQWATSVAFDPAGQNAAVGTVGGVVQVWSLARQEPTTLLLGPGVQVAQVAYSPAGGALLASLGVDNRAHLWDVGSQQYLRALGAGLRPAHALAFSPDGEWLAMAEGDRVLLWHVRAALVTETPASRSLLAPASRRGAVTAVAFSPAGGQLAVANTTGTLELWQPDATRPTRSLGGGSPALVLAYSPDGVLLASAHQDRTVRLWQARDGALLAALPGHTDLVTGLAFSPDGQRLASGGWDAVVRLWGVAQ